MMGTTKPDDVTQEAWDEAHGIVSGLVSMHEYAGRPAWDEPIARAIMAAEKRGEERERAECFRTLERVASSYLPGGPMDAKAGLILAAASIFKRGEAK